MTISTGTGSSETNLVEILRFLNLGRSATGSWEPDVYLTRDAMNTAFNGTSYHVKSMIMTYTYCFQRSRHNFSFSMACLETQG